MSDSLVIASARRTPIGAFQGVLSPVKATELGAVAARAALADAGLDPASLDEVILGCVLPAGLGQAPARQAALAAGVPTSVPAGWFSATVVLDSVTSVVSNSSTRLTGGIAGSAGALIW